MKYARQNKFEKKFFLKTCKNEKCTGKGKSEKENLKNKTA